MMFWFFGILIVIKIILVVLLAQAKAQCIGYNDYQGIMAGWGTDGCHVYLTNFTQKRIGGIR